MRTKRSYGSSLFAGGLGRAAALALAGVFLVPTAACSNGDGGQRGVTDVVREAVDQAGQRQGGRSGNISGDRNGPAPIGTRGRTSFDHAQYQRTLSTTIGLLEQYWSETMPMLDAAYTRPQAYTYYRPDQGEGPACGLQMAAPRNAFYCPIGDFIAWDESGLMIPYYVGGGDFAASFVLAHEFGRAMQTRLPRKQRRAILRALQADCFAGAWAQWVARRGLLDAGELDDATLAVFVARNMPGTAWTDPATHGSGFERTRAFGDGFQFGIEGCYPASGKKWLVAQR